MPICISIATYIALVCNKERIWKNRIDIMKIGDAIEHNPKSLNPGKGFTIMKKGNKELCDNSITSCKSTSSKGIVTTTQQENESYSKRSSNENLSLVPNDSDLKLRENITKDSSSIVSENIHLPKLSNNDVSVVHDSEIILKDSLLVVGATKGMPKKLSELKVNKNMPKDPLLLASEIDNQKSHEEIKKQFLTLIARKKSKNLKLQAVIAYFLHKTIVQRKVKKLTVLKTIKLIQNRISLTFSQYLICYHQTFHYALNRIKLFCYQLFREMTKTLRAF